MIKSLLGTALGHFIDEVYYQGYFSTPSFN